MNTENSGQRLLACTLLTMLLATAVHAQDQLDLEVLELPAITPYAPPTAPTGEQNAFTPTVTFEGRLTDEGEPMEAGLIWRVFGVAPAADGKLPLIATAQGGTTRLQLRPGSYYVHTTFGRASASTRLDVGSEPVTQTVILKAGGLRLDAMLPDGSRMRRDQLRFDIYDGLVGESTNERGLIIPNVPAGRIVRLPEGTYHVVSRYGDINAEIRADLRVQAGKTVDASIEHRAAQVTLNLVRENSGFPLPDTAWSVLDSSTGDIINERIGAFPSMVLAAGEYTAIAKHRDRLFRREFIVSPGRDITIRINTEKDEVPSEG